MFVRTASARDLAAVSRLLGEAWHETYDALDGADAVARIVEDGLSVAALSKMSAMPRSEFVVGDDGRMIGGAAFAAAAGDDARIVDLLVLGVRPALQGRGLGGMLLQEIEESFFESELLRVEFDARNDRASAFFIAEAFSRIGERQATGPGGATMVRFEKSLA